MYIQAISNTCCRKPHFTSLTPERRIDRQVQYDIPTLEDIYDSEDRIMEHQKELLEKQNKLLAQTLKALSARIVYDSNESIENYNRQLKKLENSENI